MDPQKPYITPKGTKSIHGEKNWNYTKKNPPTVAKIPRHLIGHVIMEEYMKVIKEIKSTLPVQIYSGCMCQYKYTNNQDLEKLEPNNKK